MNVIVGRSQWRQRDVADACEGGESRKIIGGGVIRMGEAVGDHGLKAMFHAAHDLKLQGILISAYGFAAARQRI